LARRSIPCMKPVSIRTSSTEISKPRLR
jgi:hypothetical protein